MSMLYRLVQSEKDALPIDVRLSGCTMLVRLLHSANARLPMEVTPSGSTMLVKPLQFSKASPPMEVTGIPLNLRRNYNLCGIAGIASDRYLISDAPIEKVAVPILIGPDGPGQQPED